MTKPNFAAWSLENLARFASEAFDDMLQKQLEIEELKIDRATLLEALRHVWAENN